jgi:hypothetical protein
MITTIAAGMSLLLAPRVPIDPCYSRRKSICTRGLPGVGDLNIIRDPVSGYSYYPLRVSDWSEGEP